MTDRPDLDHDAQRIHDKHDFWRCITELSDEAERRIVLGHFAAALLHAAIRADIRGLKDRGVTSPIIHEHGTSWSIRSADLLREVTCLHPVESGHVDILYANMERGVAVPRERREFPVYPTQYTRLPLDARRFADEIRAFLLNGELPA